MRRLEARDAFCKMVRDCGHDIVRMRASFEMYLEQYLGDYPEERRLLHDAFRVGIPEKILQHAGEADYARYLEKLGPRFAEAAHRPVDESTWAVRTWAEALDRTENYVAPTPVGRFYAEDHVVPESETIKLATQTMMTMIAGLGGVLGAGLAACIWPLAAMAIDFNPQYYGNKEETSRGFAANVLFIATHFLLPAVAGGLGAVGGWFFGRGSELPWSGFSTAFGTGMTMFFILSVIHIPFVPGLLWKPIALFCSVFAAVYKCAARGGNY